jgi:colanic acid/amylovoran biosynthesis glycosyltransferase
VETSSIAARPPDKPARQLRLVQVATLREKKGHLYTVRAFREAWRDCPGISLTLVGADAEGLRAGLERELGEARAAVTFIDRIELARLHEFLRRFDVFIHPSVHAANGDCEGGAPVVLLDAQAAGLPAIASRHCDIPEEVVDGVTGLLAAEKDVDGLAAAIRRFYDMGAAEYGSFSARAVAHVSTHYDSTRTAAALRDLYAEVLARRPGVLAQPSPLQTS